jgi:glutathione synthase/RimK-type ligase-like ATP-grasp enzyme
MTHVAIATCRGEDVDIDTPILLAAMERVGLPATMCIWDDPEVKWNDFDLTVIRSTWDYAPRRSEFLNWARGIKRLHNPFDLIEYSTDKHYLANVQDQGHRIVPTTFVEVGQSPVFPESDFVVKPCVGAGSIDAERYSPSQIDEATAHVERLHQAHRDVMIQPYIDSVDQVGERAVIFIDGTFSHAMTKGAMLNTTPDERNTLFRREQMSRAEVEPEALQAALGILASGGYSDLLYARVDLVHDQQGWALMELELVEPSLFLSFSQEAADNLARAIAKRID